MGNDLYVKFTTQKEEQEYLSQMEKTDKHYDVYVKSVMTSMEDGIPVLTAKTVAGNEVKVNIYDVALRSLERRSGDDASGHALMNLGQILEAHNLYWKLHSNREVCELLVRDDGLLQMESPQYARFEQTELFDKVLEHLEEKYTDKYEFKGGFYSHSLTEATFALKEALPESFKNAWKAAALSQSLLDKTSVALHFRTNDVGTSVAGVRIEMNVMGTRLAIGEPINIVHRNGHGSLQEFKDALDGSIVTIQEELDAMAKLMTVNIRNPEPVVVKAIKESGLVSLSKKACKELVNDMLFMGETTAYMLYLYICGFLQTEHGSGLSEERKMRAINACRNLLSADWKKWDVPGTVEL